MTAREFEAALRAARLTYPKLTRQALANMLKAYEEAGRLAAEKILTAEIMDYSHITVESWTQIQRALEDGANLIREELGLQVRSTINRGTAITAEAHTAYIMDAVEAADAGSRITEVGIRNVFSIVNAKVLRSTLNRVFTDGYSFSQRVWQVGTQYQNDIKNLISAGLAQGRDVIDIAKDLSGYLRKGKPWLVNQYGPDLIRGTKEFLARIGDRVDARALRLIRSELYMSLQEASKDQGHLAPSCTDMYDWVLQGARQSWDCDCPDLAAGGPYKYEEVPDYPHPNCCCEIRPVLRDRAEFIDDLTRWVAGDDVSYLDNWGKNIYSQAS
jgi:hypothetical protein